MIANWVKALTAHQTLALETSANPGNPPSTTGNTLFKLFGLGALTATAVYTRHYTRNYTRQLAHRVRNPSIVDVSIKLARLPCSMDGFTIVQLSDVHIGNTIGRDFVEKIVTRVNATDPDLIAITGDLVDGSVKQLREATAPLAELTAPHGVFFVTGNHEYYRGADSWIEHLQELGIRVLRNERVEIGDHQASFDLAGIDDHSAGLWQGHGPDLKRALSGRDPLRELVLLAHQPRQVHQAKLHGVGLQLSGHTHGGQIWPWHYVVRLNQRGLLAGHYRFDETQLYVSSGTGYWGPPLRVASESEISRITLRSHNSPPDPVTQ